MATNRAPIGVVVITRNERHNIEACLASAAFAEEIVVVDAESEDGTADLARRAGAIVISQPWQGFSAQRQLGFDRVTKAWTLWLDADERVGPSLVAEISTVVSNDDAHVDGYLIPRRHLFLGGWLRHGGEFPASQLRLFRSGKGKLNGAAVHEVVVIPAGRLRSLAQPIDHHSSPDLETRLGKARLYASLSAQHAVTTGLDRGIGWLSVVRNPSQRLAHLLIRERGYLDGWRGLVWAIVAAYEQGLIALNVLRLRRSDGHA